MNYKASKTRVPDRQGWVAVFRHPVRKDKTGKVYRVRAGLGTRNEAEADRLISQLDELLQNESYWNLGARDIASRRFDPRVVNIFFENMTPQISNPLDAREEIIPLPDLSSGYSKVRFVGATGAGKTTLLRQLIGSDPNKDRFPSTSTAKTTTCDIEIVISPDPIYKAVVTFMAQDLVRNYVKECVVAAAVVAADEESSIDEISRKLLEHVEQRFRLSYILGSASELREDKLEDQLEDEDDEEDSKSETETSEISAEDRKSLIQKLSNYIERLKTVGKDQKESAIGNLGIVLETVSGQEEQDAIQDHLEENIQETEEIEEIVDDILDDIEDRFQWIKFGMVERDQLNWPIRWQWESNDRTAFIEAVNKFTSNYAPNFGRLLTPIVLGIRVQGPFKPTWLDQESLPRLVFIDGEGLGHTPETVASLSTSITQSYENANVILLVDNAQQPMQGAALAALRSVCTGGHQSKLALAFTHFDQVRGSNFSDNQARRDHVQNSLHNAINTFSNILGTSVKRSLERALEDKIFYLSKIQEGSQEKNHSTRKQLQQIIEVLQKPTRPENISDYKPRYDVANLAIAVHSATEAFQKEWQARLLKEHWTRIKALSRRVAVFQQDEYSTLKPVADLIRLLSERLTPFVVNPRGWQVAPPTEEVQSSIVDKIRQSIYSQLHDLAFQRICLTYIREWANAYELRGTGTARERAQKVRNIYELAVPIPGETPRPESSLLLDEVRKVFKTAAETVGAELN